MQPRTISLGRQTQDPAPIGAAGAENSVPIEAINPEALSPFNSQRLEAGQKAPQHAASLCVLSSPIVQHRVVGGSVRIETANAGSSVRTDAASSAAPLSPKRFDTGQKPSQQAASPCVQSSPIMQHRAVAGGSVCVEAASLVAPFSPKRLESGQKSPQQASSPSVPNSPIMQHRLVGASYPDPQRSSGEPRAALAPATNVRSNIEPLAPRQESMLSAMSSTARRDPSFTSGDAQKRTPDSGTRHMQEECRGYITATRSADDGLAIRRQSHSPQPSFLTAPLIVTSASRKVCSSSEVSTARASPLLQPRVPSRIPPDVPTRPSPVLPHRAVPATRPLQGASAQKAPQTPQKVCRPVPPVHLTPPTHISANVPNSGQQPLVATSTMQAKGTSRPRKQEQSQETPVLKGPQALPSCQPWCSGDIAADDVPDPKDVRQQVFDVAIPESLHHALLSMGTSTGKNAVMEFITEAQASPEAVTPSIWRYWEKRRVQNALRRILEKLQECLDYDDVQLVANLPLAFDEIMRRGKAFRGMERSIDMNAGTIDERGFWLVLEAMGAMPRELYEADRGETFAAIIIPTAAAAKAAIHKGILPPKVLTRDIFRKGLSQVPFNLPDFPVPLYLLKEQPRTFHVMEDVVKTFARNAKGQDVTRDFLLTGTISVEEIQALLSCLVPFRAVEDAVLRIIRTASKQGTIKDWTFFVKSRSEFDVIQNAENQAAMDCDNLGEESKLDLLGSPSEETRPIHVEKEPWPGGLEVSPCSEVIPQTPEILPREVTFDSPSPSKDEKVRTVPQTEPLPNRQVRPEPSPDASKTPGPGFRQLHRPMVVDWNTVLKEVGAGSALMKLATGGDDAAGPCEKDPHCSQRPDLTMILSLEQHSEGRGPFLTAPLVRCCELCSSIF